MKTVIFRIEVVDDVYNDASVINMILNGESVLWKVWYNGDERRKCTKTEQGDRFFILQEEKGIIASGIIGNVVFSPGKSKLVNCGMNLIELIPDKIGSPILNVDQFREIVSQQIQDETVLETKKEAMSLEISWIKAVIENNSCKEKVSPNIWKIENLHKQTVDALTNHILSIKRTCACCGATTTSNDTLFFKPSISNNGDIDIYAFDDLLNQYSILCKECASIERELQ